MVRYADKLIGKVMAKLDELRLRTNTITIFTADYGTKRSNTAVLNDGTLYPGGKGSTADNGIHEPLIANWPGHVPAGTVNTNLVSFCDLLPTVCDIAGAPLPKNVRTDGLLMSPF